VSREKQAKSCDYEEFEGQDLGYADIQVVARNPKEVRSTLVAESRQIFSAMLSQSQPDEENCFMQVLVNKYII
jgi:hypothetical protein